MRGLFVLSILLVTLNLATAHTTAPVAARPSPGAPNLFAGIGAFQADPLLRLSADDLQSLVDLGELAQTPLGAKLGLGCYSFLAAMDPQRGDDERRADAPMLSPVAQVWRNRDLAEGVRLSLEEISRTPPRTISRLAETSDGWEKLKRLLNPMYVLRTRASEIMGQGLEDISRKVSRPSASSPKADVRSGQPDIETMQEFLSAVEDHPFYGGVSAPNRAIIQRVREKAMGAASRIKEALAPERVAGTNGHMVAAARPARRHMAGLRPASALETVRNKGVAESPEFIAALEKVDIYARTDWPMLVLGPSGAGKEVVSAAIHYASNRARKPLIVANAANLGSVPESQLFGSVEGAFTDATSNKGLISAAEGGTLFLDEVDQLPLSVQRLLLRFLEEKTYFPVGGDKELTADVRVVAATNADLPRLIAEGKFLPDLYERLNQVVRVPALKDRIADIEPLARHFWKRFAGVRPFETAFTPTVIEALRRHQWPGNVRELRNAMQRAAALSGPDGSVTEEHLFPLVEAFAPVPELGAKADTLQGLRALLGRLHQFFTERAQSLLQGSAGSARKETLAGKTVYSDPMLALAGKVRQAGATDATVLITGETGTGKEVVAQALYQESARRGKPFLAINAGSISETLVDSELFGHVRGAFTGARSDREGKFRQARGGTIFLDEISRLPLSAQAKLLRFLDTGEVQAVGSQTPGKIDVRVIAATNEDLWAKVQDGSFREDLYHRLNVIQLSVAPLRWRPADILPLASRFWEEAEVQLQPGGSSRSFEEAFSEEARGWLLAHAWTRNVRELRNAMRNAAANSLARRSKVVSLADLFPDGGYVPFTAATREGAERISQDAERDFYERVLQRHAGDVNAAAVELGVSPEAFSQIRAN